MKTYLTENGLLVVRPYDSFFTSNSGKFRRLATKDEVKYLIEQVGLMQVNPVWESEEAASYEKSWETMQKLATMKIPLWHYLWSVHSRYYSGYKHGMCSNGGNYAFFTKERFFARCVDGAWEIKSLKVHSTSAGFSYDELNARFQNTAMGYLNLIGVAEENPWEIYTQTMDGNNEDIIIDRLLKGNYTLEEAINAKGYYIPEADSDKEEGEIPLSEEGIQRRKEIADKLGITATPKRRGSGRNERRA